MLLSIYLHSLNVEHRSVIKGFFSKKHYFLSANNFEALLRTIAQIKNIGKLQKNILATQKMHYNLIITRPHILLAIQTQSVAVLHSCM